MIRAVLFDLDGVIRHFNPEETAAIEQRHRLTEGALGEAAFSRPLLSEVTTGRITRAEWVQRIGDRLGNATAAAEWSRLVSSVDATVLEHCEPHCEHVS